MSYHVLPVTMAQVRAGALKFQRELTASLNVSSDVARNIKIYSASPFDLEARRKMKDRFSGDVVYFFNDAAKQECERLGLALDFVAQIEEEDLPRRRTLFVGVPDVGR